MDILLENVDEIILENTSNSYRFGVLLDIVLLYSSTVSTISTFRTKSDVSVVFRHFAYFFLKMAML